VCGKSIGEGTGFASRVMDGVPVWNRLPEMSPAAGAAVLGFQAWCSTGDSEILGNRADGLAFSIDHDDCLQGYWDWDGVMPVQVSMSRATARPGAKQFASRALFHPFLCQLESLPHADIVAACEQFPPDWGVEPNESERLGQFLIERSGLTGDAVMSWCDRD
jgi:hypothetical protein